MKAPTTLGTIQPTYTKTINSGTSTEMALTRIGNIVTLRFEPGQKTTTTGTAAPTISFSVPAGYRPATKVVGVLYFGVNPPGNFSINTNGSGNAYTASAGTDWMRFGAVYVTTDPYPTN